MQFNITADNLIDYFAIIYKHVHKVKLYPGQLRIIRRYIELINDELERQSPQDAKESH